MYRMFVVICQVCMVTVCLGQDDLLGELTKGDDSVAMPVSTFHGTRLVNGHSVQTKHKGELEFIITHRFGRLNSGGYNLWGLDDSFIRIGLEYGITDKLGIGFGRSSFDKSFDYYAKYKVVQQNTSIPVTVTALASTAYNASYNRLYPELKTEERMAYTAQVMIARKFSPGFSFQVAPTFLHRAAVEQSMEVNGLFSLGMGTRVQVTRSMAILGEYYLRMNEKAENPNQNAIGLSIEFDTGGHIFHLVFTNAQGMMERAFLAETSDDFFGGDIHFGFNITRTFQLAGKK